LPAVATTRLILAGALWLAAILLVAHTFAPDGER
jgi:preprotein translocase subunit Sec61beta